MINNNLLQLLSKKPSPKDLRESGFDYSHILSLISDLSYLCLNSMPSQIELPLRHQKMALTELWVSIHEKRNEKACFGDMNNYADSLRTTLRRVWENLSITFGSNDTYGFAFCEISEKSKFTSNNNFQLFIDFAAENKQAIDNDLQNFGVTMNQCEKGILIIRKPYYKDFNTFTAINDANAIIHSAINSLPTKNKCENKP